MFNEERQDRHCYIPGFLYDADIGAQQKIVAGRLYALSNQTGFCYATNEWLAEDVGITKRSIQRCLKLLEGEGLIIRKSDEQGNRRIYPLNPHDKNQHGTKKSSSEHEENFAGGTKKSSCPSDNRVNSRDKNTQSAGARENGKKSENHGNQCDDQVHDVIRFWNGFDFLTEVRELMGSHHTAVAKKLNNYEPREIKQAIRNYAKVFSDESSQWDCRYTLRGFVHCKHFAKFVDGTDWCYYDNDQQDSDSVSKKPWT